MRRRRLVVAKIQFAEVAARCASAASTILT
jgi:hypothetical protein